VATAADRAAELFARTARGQVAAGRVDSYPNPAPRLDVLVRSERANRMLGTSFPVAEIGQLLRRVSAAVKATGRGGYLCRVPSCRSDLTREADFIEEIARIGGYDRIPPTQPRAALAGTGERPARRLETRMRDLLAAQGLNEMICRRFVGTQWNLRVSGVAPSGVRGIALRNPMSTDATEMRVSLLPGLLAAAAHNRRQGESWVRSFEIGNVFWTDGTIQERKVIGGVLLGAVPQRGLLRDSRPESFYDAKGVVEALLEGLGVASVRWGAADVPSFLHPGKAATVRREADVLGYVGGFHPEVAKAADVGEVWGFELDFAKLESYARRRFTFQPLPKYPAIVRDLAIVADETFEAQAVLETIDVCSDLPVESAQLFDLYRGDPLPAGKKSLAYSIAYRDPSRTLTDEEVNRLHQSLIERITRQLGVALRA
jgi:phenylalanyl-tRNA synthetase beta chain